MEKKEHSMSKKGPFGLWMGMTHEEFEYGLSEIAPFTYRVETVPKPHSAFEYYILKITPKAGLSWIKTIGNTVQTSVYGNELQTAFESLEKKLTAAYRKGEEIDFLMTDSIWDEPKDWMQSLLLSERYLAKIWSSEKGSTLTDSLISVGIFANATDTNSGFISLEYSFQNFDSAEVEISASDDEAL